METWNFIRKNQTTTEKSWKMAIMTQNKTSQIWRKTQKEIQRQCFEEKDEAPYRKVLKALKALKIEFEFYDQEGELDMMLSDRHDDDFDEDSMNIFAND